MVAQPNPLSAAVVHLEAVVADLAAAAELDQLGLQAPQDLMVTTEKTETQAKMVPQE